MNQGSTDCGVGLPVARHGNSTFSPLSLAEKYSTPAGGPTVIDGGACAVQYNIHNP